jgi:hypothetical protein
LGDTVYPITRSGSHAADPHAPLRFAGVRAMAATWSKDRFWSSTSANSGGAMAVWDIVPPWR